VLQAGYGPTGSWHTAFCMLLKANFEQFRPHCSPKLASGGIVDPSNAAALLHVSHMNPKMGFSLCSRQAMAQLGHGTQPFACCSRQFYCAHPPTFQPKADFWRDCGPIQCCCTASCLSYGSKDGVFIVLQAGFSPTGSWHTAFCMLFKASLFLERSIAVNAHEA
jgi:hypothetical protein